MKPVDIDLCKLKDTRYQKGIGFPSDTGFQ